MGFPFETEEEITESESIKVPREYEIDFSTGQLTGRIVEGTEAIKVWVYNALKAQRYRYNVYSWDYGHELEDLIGENYTPEYLDVEAKRMVEECLSVNEFITGIDNFIVSTNGDQLLISFTVNTLFGEVDIIV